MVTFYSTDGKWYSPIRAMNKVMKAVQSGELIRSESCQLCGASPKPALNLKKNGKWWLRPTIHAHHWNGYDNPLDVWWICQSCNSNLAGHKFHSGQVNMEEAREVIERKRAINSKVVTRCQGTTVSGIHAGQQCKRRVVNGDYCKIHQP